MTALVVSELTASTLQGTGVFDVLMRSVKVHLESEFLQGRIKGPEYSTVYLGSLDLAMQTSLQFVLQQRRNDLEAQLLQKQIELITQQIASATAEALNVPKQGLLLDAQRAQVSQQTTNLVAEALNIPKQGALLDAQVSVAVKQIDIATAEILIKQQQVLVAQAEVAIATAKLVNIPKEGAQLDAQTLLTGQQKINLIAEATNIPKQGAVLDAQVAMSTQQKLNLIAEKDAIVAKTAMTTQQTANAVIEALVLTAQKCKLQAEFDLTVSQTLKSAQELALLTQKVVTEKAQTVALGVDDNSVIGKQKLLYAAQTTGFTRDAEQKVAKLMADTWSVRRTTDEATVADGTNLLNDVTVGRAITKLLSGVGA